MIAYAEEFTCFSCCYTLKILSFFSPLKLQADSFCAANGHFRCPALASELFTVPQTLGSSQPCAAGFLVSSVTIQ